MPEQSTNQQTKDHVREVGRRRSATVAGYGDSGRSETAGSSGVRFKTPSASTSRKLSQAFMKAQAQSLEGVVSEQVLNELTSHFGRVLDMHEIFCLRTKHQELNKVLDFNEAKQALEVHQQNPMGLGSVFGGLGMPLTTPEENNGQIDQIYGNEQERQSRANSYLSARNSLVSSAPPSRTSSVSNEAVTGEQSSAPPSRRSSVSNAAATGEQPRRSSAPPSPTGGQNRSAYLVREPEDNNLQIGSASVSPAEVFSLSDWEILLDTTLMCPFGL
jgi:hypothetical protein